MARLSSSDIIAVMEAACEKLYHRPLGELSTIERAMFQQTVSTVLETRAKLDIALIADHSQLTLPMIGESHAIH